LTLTGSCRLPHIGDHGRHVDDCPLATLPHQRGKFRNEEEVRCFDIERIHTVKDFLRRFVRPAEREDPRVVNKNVDVTVSEF
jgi:hypothetical protein